MEEKGNVKIQADSESLKITMETLKKQLERLIEIQEEKKRGGSELRGSMAIESRKSEVPIFDGHNTAEWILKVEKYFALESLKDEEEVEVSASSLEGVALRWFKWEHHRRPFRRWEDLKGMILRQFPIDGCSSGEGFLTLKQGATRKRDNTKKNLLEKKREDTIEKDRDKGKVGFVDSLLESLPPSPTPSSPSSLSPASSAPLSTAFPILPILSPSIAETMTTNQLQIEKMDSEVSSKPILGNLHLSKPKPKPKPNQSYSLWPKFSHVLSIRPKPVLNLIRAFLYSPNYVSLTAEREEWLADDHWKLPPPWPPPLLPPSLPSPLPPLLPLPTSVIDVNCWNQFQFDFFPP